MQTLFGVDYSWARPDPRCLRGFGVAFALRYLSIDPGKRLAWLELERLLGAGVAVGLVGQERHNTLAEFTPEAGYADAVRYREQAATLGARRAAPIHFPIDFDATEAELRDVIVHYANAYRDGLAGQYAAGVYGSKRVVSFALDNWPGVPFAWQTYAWSGGAVEPRAQLYQFLNGQSVCGAAVDFDVCRDPRSLAWA